ncbi:hypothetical protein [Micromonospora avicenniae]|uniref:hypothetical protein n=1 Tax=Micromonospora avicenniae TaxID=1198245 RepID=UPI00332E0C59
MPAPVTRKPHAKGLHVAALATADAPTWQVSVAVPASAPPGPASTELLRMALPERAAGTPAAAC